jgi:WD40 repeat protein
MGALDFEKSLAVVIGINQYGNGITPLRTAVTDARSVADLLEQKHEYQVISLLNEQARLAELKTLIQETLPTLLSANSRLLLYFAGHGIAQDGDDGPAGYLIPKDATPGNVASYLSMVALHDALTALPCRHLLAIFDCCFAGAFRWSSTRKITVVPEVMHRERYDRFRRDPAWQVITSASYDQPAMDVLSLRDDRGEIVDDNAQHHSPFATALIQALQGKADMSPPAREGKPAGDGVTTATELYLYLRDQVEVLTESQRLRQTPEICTLCKHDKGEYIFLTPGYELDLPPAPVLSKENNPYRALESFDQVHQDLFFGRDSEIERLLAKLDEPNPMVVVVGASGTGKSSLVKAGLLPRLTGNPAFSVLPVMRPGIHPLEALARACMELVPTSELQVLNQQFTENEQSLAQLIEKWQATHPKAKLLLVIDQAEELITQASTQTDATQFQRLIKLAMAEHWQYFRVVATLRLDFEAQFQESDLREAWMDSRFVIPPMGQVQLREAIEKPAAARVLYFEPSSLVDKLVEDVAQTPGALPLLSFTLSELYLCYLERRSENRALTEADYRALGGVAGSLTRRATQDYEGLVAEDKAYEQTVKHVMLRMVSLEGGELARRRVPLSELVYGNKAENERVQKLLEKLIESRLLVRGQEGEGEAYVEPAHDALVRSWDKLLRWRNTEQVYLGLQRELTPQAMNWQAGETSGQSKQSRGFLWDENPRLDLLKAVLASDKNWLNSSEESFVRRSAARKRNRRTQLIASLSAVIVGLSGISVIALIQRQEARRQTTVAQLREQAARVLNSLPTANSVSGLILAIDSMDRSRSVPFVKVVTQASLLNALQVSQEINRLSGHEKTVFSAAFSPDGQRIVSGSSDNTLRLWDAKTGAVIGEPLVGHEAPVLSVAFSPDGQRIVSSSFDKTLRLWDAKTGAAIGKPLAGHEAPVLSVAFSPDGQRIVSGSRDKMLRLWDAKTGAAIGESLVGHGDEVRSVAFSPDGQRLVSGSFDTTLRLWDAKTGAAIGEPLAGHEAPVLSVAFSPDGQRLVSGSLDNTLRLWDAETGAAIGKPLVGHGDEVQSVAFSPDGQRLVSGSLDNTLRLWDAETGTAIGEPLTGHGDAVMSVAFSPDSQHIISGSVDNTLRLWDARRGVAIKGSLVGHKDEVYSVAFSPDGQRLVSGSFDNTLRLWDAKTGAAIGKPLAGHEDDVYSVAFSPDGQRLVSGSRDKTLRLWDAKTGAAIGKPLVGHGDTVWAVAFSPDGQRLVSGSRDKTLRLWNAKTGAVIGKPLTGHGAEVLSVAFSSDSLRLVSGSKDETLRLWDAKTGAAIGGPLTGHLGPILSVAFSPNGQRLVSASRDNTLRLWDAETGMAIGDPLAGHEDAIYSVAFSPNGQYLVSGSRDNTLRLWDAETGTAIGGPFSGHGDAVFSVAFSPNGQHLVSGGRDNTLRLWDASPEAWMELACKRLQYHPLLNRPETITSNLAFHEVVARSRAACQHSFNIEQ